MIVGENYHPFKSRSVMQRQPMVRSLSPHLGFKSMMNSNSKDNSDLLHLKINEDIELNSPVFGRDHAAEMQQQQNVQKKNKYGSISPKRNKNDDTGIQDRQTNY